MSIFNFSNLIKPENSGNPVKTETTKLRASEPSFKDLVKKIVDEKHAASQESKSEPMSVAAPVPVEIPVEKKPEPVKVREEIVVVPENLPAIPEPEEIVNFQPAILPAQEVKSEINLAENQTYGTFFLKTMLTEFSDILQAGKDLEVYEQNRKDISNELSTNRESFRKQIEKRDELRKNIVSLLNEETLEPELLNNSLRSYEQYLNAIENSYKETFKLQEDQEDQFVKKIQKKRIELKGVVNKIGGTEVFNSIKKVVTFCKEQRLAQLNKEGVANVKESLRKEIETSVTNFVEGDLHGAVMLAESGDMIGLMMRIYNSPQK